VWLRIRAYNQEKRRVHHIAIEKEKSGQWSEYTVLKSPKACCLIDEAHRHNLLKLIHEIRQNAVTGNSKILIDFSDTKQFLSGGTLLLLSEISRILHYLPKTCIRGKQPRNSKAAQVLKQVGLAKLLKINIKAKVKDHDVVNWKCATGQGAQGEKYDTILGSYEGVIAEALSDNLYRGLTEAMTNAHHHAYIAARGDGLSHCDNYKPWWMFSQEKDELLTVVFCDLGLGIPKTLPIKQPKWWQVAERFQITNQGDGKLIQGAVRNSQSRTRLLHRGKGLRQIADAVTTAGSGIVNIYSNKGLYQLKSGTEFTFNYTDSIMGTVIQWSLPLKRTANDHE